MSLISKHPQRRKEILEEIAREKLNSVVPDQPISPPSPTPEDYERRLRDSCRRDILSAISLIEDRLEELGQITRERCLHLTALRNEIAADFED